MWRNQSLFTFLILSLLAHVPPPPSRWRRAVDQPVTRSLYFACSGGGGEGGDRCVTVGFAVELSSLCSSTRTDTAAEGAQTHTHTVCCSFWSVCGAFLCAQQQAHTDRTCHGAWTTKTDPAPRGAAAAPSQAACCETSKKLRYLGARAARERLQEKATFGVGPPHCRADPIRSVPGRFNYSNTRTRDLLFARTSNSRRYLKGRGGEYQASIRVLIIN